MIVILQTFRSVSLDSDDVTLCVVSGAVDIAAGVEAARPEAAQGEGSLPMGLVTLHRIIHCDLNNGKLSNY